jgi:transcriptional regulator GlxA family with amidase domain
VVLLGRTVLLIVARWFVLGARERERDMQFSAGSGRFERHNTLLPRVALYVWSVTSGVS